MNDLHEKLSQLPEPDPEAVDRLWKRYQSETSPWRHWKRAAGAMVPLAAAAGALWFMQPESTRSMDISSELRVTNLKWSEQVQVSAVGAGSIQGSDRNVTIDWESGAIEISVEPNTQSQVTVLTPEARVEVLGTVYSVTRDAMGSTVEVTQGRVNVTCHDGPIKAVDSDDPPVTCLPVTAARMLRRADALLDANVNPLEILASVDRGLAMADPQEPTYAELLFRRMRLQPTVEGQLADAQAYVELDAPTRLAEVQRFAGWLALSEQGCDAAMAWLTPLSEQGSPQEQVLVAECISHERPDEARALLLSALPLLDGEWADRAGANLAALHGVP